MAKEPLLVIARKVDTLQEAILTVAEQVDRLEEATLTIARKVDKMEKAIMALAKSSDLIVKNVDSNTSCCVEGKVDLAGKHVKQLNQVCLTINGKKFIVAQAYVNGRKTPLSNCVKHEGTVVGRFKD